MDKLKVEIRNKLIEYFEHMGSITDEDLINDIYDLIDNSACHQLLCAVQDAYRKHHMEDESIGWNELGDILQCALCEAMGDDGYQRWSAKIRHTIDNPGDTGKGGGE